MATAKGLMHQKRKNFKFSNTQEPKQQDNTLMEPLTQRTDVIFANIIDLQQRISIDITACLPVTSNGGNNYLFVL